MEKPPTSTKGPIPQHNSFSFPEILFSSSFDSGNLQKVEKLSSNHFALWVCPDCFNTQSEKSFRSWFFFSVTTKGCKTFTIKNLNLQGKLFRDGMKPLYKTESQDWKRLESSLNCDVRGEVGSYFEVTFVFDFHPFQDSPVFFAFSFPWTYSDSQASMKLLKNLTGLGFYLHVGCLVSSLEKRNCEMITISSEKGILNEREEEISGLFEDNDRPFKFFGKKIVFVSARVHPGETPSSHVVNGMIEFLLSDDDRAKVLRDLFVFKLVPMLNPDGVYRGYYRTDTRGHDLNRVYAEPSLAKHPTIFAVTSVLKYHGADVWAYVDLHAHVSKQGCFVYGNSLEYQDQVMNVLFAKIMSNTCPWFNFDSCCFLDESYNKEKYGKDGCGRVVAQKVLNLVHSYTLEVNYHSSKGINSVQENSEYKNSVLDVGTFKDIGQMALVGLLYLSEKHPFPIVNVNQIKLETGKILAELPQFRNNPEARKASKSIENLNRLINSSKDNGKKFKCRIANILIEKKARRSLNSSTPNALPQIQYPQFIKDFALNKGKEFNTKVVVSNENSFQIRPRNSSFVKNRRFKKVKKISLKVQDFSKHTSFVIL